MGSTFDFDEWYSAVDIPDKPDTTARGIVKDWLVANSLHARCALLKWDLLNWPAKFPCGWKGSLEFAIDELRLLRSQGECLDAPTAMFPIVGNKRRPSHLEHNSAIIAKLQGVASPARSKRKKKRRPLRVRDESSHLGEDGYDADGKSYLSADVPNNNNNDAKYSCDFDEAVGGRRRQAVSAPEGRYHEVEHVQRRDYMGDTDKKGAPKRYKGHKPTASDIVAHRIPAEVEAAEALVVVEIPKDHEMPTRDCAPAVTLAAAAISSDLYRACRIGESLEASSLFTQHAFSSTPISSSSSSPSSVTKPMDEAVATAVEVAPKVTPEVIELSKTDAMGFTPLMSACVAGRSLCVSKLLLRDTSEPLAHMHEATGRNALMLAGLSGHLECVHAILEYASRLFPDGCAASDTISSVSDVSAISDTGGDAGYIINATDHGGKTALMLACEAGHCEVVTTLLQFGAAAELEDYEGRSAVFFAAANGNAECVSALLDTSSSESLGTDRSYLITDPGASDKTALMVACEYGHAACVRLLAQRADAQHIHQRDDMGRSALSYACRAGSTECVRVLLRVGADVHTRDRTQCTALMFAAAAGARDCVKLLLECGCNPWLRDLAGLAAADHAEKHSHGHCVETLLLAMANRNAYAQAAAASSDIVHEGDYESSASPLSSLTSHDVFSGPEQGWPAEDPAIPNESSQSSQEQQEQEQNMSAPVVTSVDSAGNVAAKDFRNPFPDNTGQAYDAHKTKAECDGQQYAGKNTAAVASSSTHMHVLPREELEYNNSPYYHAAANRLVPRLKTSLNSRGCAYVIEKIDRHIGDENSKIYMEFLVHMANTRPATLWVQWKNIRNAAKLHDYLRKNNLASLIPLSIARKNGSQLDPSLTISPAEDSSCLLNQKPSLPLPPTDCAEVFIKACDRGDEQLLREMLATYTSLGPHTADKDSITALMYSAMGGYVHCVQLLLSAYISSVHEVGAMIVNVHQAVPAVNSRDKLGQSALMYACFKGHFKVVRLLLEAGADASLRNVRDQSALMIAQRRGHLRCERLMRARETAAVECVGAGVMSSLVEVVASALAEPTSMLRPAPGNNDNHSSTGRRKWRAHSMANEASDSDTDVETETISHHLFPPLIRRGRQKSCQQKRQRLQEQQHHDTEEERLYKEQDSHKAPLQLREAEDMNIETDGEDEGLMRESCRHYGTSDQQSVFSSLSWNNGLGADNLAVGCSNFTPAGDIFEMDRDECVGSLFGEFLDDDAVSVVSALSEAAATTLVYDGHDPLLLACRDGDDVTVAALIAAGTGVDEEDDAGWFPIMLASYYDQLECLELLLSGGADVNKNGGENQSAGSPPGVNFALDWACHGRSLRCAKLLIEEGAQVNCQDYCGISALSVASDTGRADIVSLLLQHSANVNACMHNGWTALTNASYRGHSDVVQLLISAGADVNNKCAETGSTALLFAASASCSETCLELLLSAGALVDERNDHGATALLLAAEAGAFMCISQLLSAGAYVDTQDNTGRTALMKASYLGHTECVASLLDYSADVHLRDNRGKTALQWATSEAVLQILHEAFATQPQATISSPDSSGLQQLQQSPGSHVPAGVMYGDKGNIAPASQVSLASSSSAAVVVETVVVYAETFEPPMTCPSRQTDPLRICCLDGEPPAAAAVQPTQHQRNEDVIDSLSLGLDLFNAEMTASDDTPELAAMNPIDPACASSASLTMRNSSNSNEEEDITFSEGSCSGEMNSELDHVLASELDRVLGSELDYTLDSLGATPLRHKRSVLEVDDDNGGFEAGASRGRKSSCIAAVSPFPAVASSLEDSSRAKLSTEAAPLNASSHEKGHRKERAVSCTLVMSKYPKNAKIAHTLLQLHTGLITASSSGDMGKVNSVLQDVAKLLDYLEGVTLINTRSRGEGNTALHAACLHGHSDVARCLINNNACVNIDNYAGRKPLFLASMSCHIACVDLLLKSGGAMYINHTDKSKATSLLWAVENDHVGCVEALLRAGAEVDITPCVDDSTPISAAKSDAIRNMLHDYAIKQGGIF